MSYNHGPMISERHFDEFIAPYYRRIVPRLQEMGAIMLVDTDGDVTRLVPWLLREGIRGRAAAGAAGGRRWHGVAAQFPELRHGRPLRQDDHEPGRGGDAREFERLAPLMSTGGFIPSVDHQTPPGVSLDQYRLYLQLLQEYTVATRRRLPPLSWSIAKDAEIRVTISRWCTD